MAQTCGPSGVLSPLRGWWTCGLEWSQAKFKTCPMGILAGCHEHRAALYPGGNVTQVALRHCELRVIYNINV